MKKKKTISLLPQYGKEATMMTRRTQWPFSATQLVIAWWVPESPLWLLRSWRIGEAVMAMGRLRCGGRGKGAQRLVAALKVQQRNSGWGKGKAEMEAEAEAEVVEGDRQCFMGADRRRIVVVVIANLLPQFFGVRVLGNAAYFMQTIGMDVANSIRLLQVGIALGLISNLICVWNLSVASRKPMMLVTLAITTLLWTAIGVAGIFSGQVMIW